MVEFAMVLPILFAILFLSIAVSLIYTVRVAEHKAAYDAARHVAKSYKVLLKESGPSDRIDGCPDTADFKDAYQSAQDVVDVSYNASSLMRGLATHPRVVKVSTGPPIDAQGGNASYYCNMAMSVTIRYTLTVPTWDILGHIYGQNGTSDLVETGVAVRLARDYENVPPEQQGPAPSPSQ